MIKLLRSARNATIPKAEVALHSVVRWRGQRHSLCSVVFSAPAQSSDHHSKVIVGLWTLEQQLLTLDPCLRDPDHHHLQPMVNIKLALGAFTLQFGAFHFLYFVLLRLCYLGRLSNNGVLLQELVFINYWLPVLSIQISCPSFPFPFFLHI